MDGEDGKNGSCVMDGVFGCIAGSSEHPKDYLLLDLPSNRLESTVNIVSAATQFQLQCTQKRHQPRYFDELCSTKRHTTAVKEQICS